MLATTMREQQGSASYPVTEKIGQLSSPTMMSSWASSLLNYPRVQVTRCFGAEKDGALTRAKQAVTQKGIAFLLIDATSVGINTSVPTTRDFNKVGMETINKFFGEDLSALFAQSGTPLPTHWIAVGQWAGKSLQCFGGAPGDGEGTVVQEDKLKQALFAVIACWSSI